MQTKIEQVIIEHLFSHITGQIIVKEPIEGQAIKKPIFPLAQEKKWLQHQLETASRYNPLPESIATRIMNVSETISEQKKYLNDYLLDASIDEYEYEYEYDVDIIMHYLEHSKSKITLEEAGYFRVEIMIVPEETAHSKDPYDDWQQVERLHPGDECEINTAAILNIALDPIGSTKTHAWKSALTDVLKDVRQHQLNQQLDRQQRNNPALQEPEEVAPSFFLSLITSETTNTIGFVLLMAGLTAMGLAAFGAIMGLSVLNYTILGVSIAATGQLTLFAHEKYKDEVQEDCFLFETSPGF